VESHRENEVDQIRGETGTPLQVCVKPSNRDGQKRAIFSFHSEEFSRDSPTYSKEMGKTSQSTGPAANGHGAR